MLNYLKLCRNLRKYSPRAEAASATYIYNAKGIYDFKQMNPEISEALTDSFRGVNNPVLEISVKKAKHPAGIITVKDGDQKLSQDIFVLDSGERFENFLPKTDGCTKKLIFDAAGIERLGEQFDLLKKLLDKLTYGIKKPVLEVLLKENDKFSIGKLVLHDGDKKVLSGFFSKTKNREVPVEKCHISKANQLVCSYGNTIKTRVKRIELLPEKLRKRLWMLDERTKSMFKSRYGIDCSPESAKNIAKQWNLTSSRVREIINYFKEEMESANTYNKELGSDLDNLGSVLSDKERYNLYRRGSSLDINMAVYKIKKQSLLKYKI